MCAERRLKACCLGLLISAFSIVPGSGQDVTNSPSPVGAPDQANTTNPANPTPQQVQNTEALLLPQPSLHQEVPTPKLHASNHVPFIGSPTIQMPEGMPDSSPEWGSGAPGNEPPPPQPGTAATDTGLPAGQGSVVNAPMTPNLPLMPGQQDTPEKVSLPGDEWNASANSPATNPAITTGQESDSSTGLPFLRASTDLGRLAIPMVEPNLTGLPNAAEMQAQMNGGAPVSSEAEGRHWRIVPRLNLGTYYDSNIFITHDNPVASMVSQAGAGFGYQLGGFNGMDGNSLSFSYEGTGIFFSGAPAQNAYNQTAQLLASYQWTRLRAKLASSYYYLSGPNRDTGSFVNSSLFRNELEFVYSYSSKTDIKFAIAEIGNYFASANSSEAYFARLGANHEVTSKMRLGLEVDEGYNTLQNSPNQTFQKYLATLLYNATGKLNLRADGGFQVTEFGNSGQAPFGTPVLKLGAEYIPFGDKQALNYTEIDLNAYREIFNSASLVSQDYAATGVAVNLLRAYHQWLPAMNLGFEDDAYFATAPGISATRRDNFVFIRPNLGYQAVKWLKANVFFAYRQNLSNIDQYGWSGYQAGISFSSAF